MTSGLFIGFTVPFPCANHRMLRSKAKQLLMEIRSAEVYVTYGSERKFMAMTGDEVLQILNLMEKSSFDFLELEVGELKLTVSKSGYKPGGSDRNPMTASRSAAPGESTTAAEQRGQPQADGEEMADTEGLVAITASMVGTFYRAPEPGAPPFVDVGGRVDEDTTVGLIEVMKVFSSVAAGVRGVISKVLVSNAQFVEYGQKLFLVKPDGDGKGKSR